MQPCPFCGTAVPAGSQSCPACGRALPAPKSSKGTKVAIGLAIAGGCALIGIPVLGILAAIAIPNLVNATQRAKQHRTLSDLRTISVKLEEHRAEKGVYPGGDEAAVAAALQARGWTGKWEDGWQHPLRWACFEEQDGGCVTYELVSPGKDGVFEQGKGGYEEGPFPPNQYDADVVMTDGRFMRWPEGTGRDGGG